MTALLNLEPRAAARPKRTKARLCLVVGRNSHGLWIVRERLGRCGGVFTTRTEAIRFALEEARDGAGAAVLVTPEFIKLFPSATARKVAS